MDRRDPHGSLLSFQFSFFSDAERGEAEASPTLKCYKACALPHPAFRPDCESPPGTHMTRSSNYSPDNVVFSRFQLLAIQYR